MLVSDEGMSSGLTLGQARAQLPTAALSAQNAATATLAAAQINPATSWLITSGKWRGTVQRAVFDIRTLLVDDEQQPAYITLPRSMLTVEAAVFQGTGDQYRSWQRVDIANEWYQWIPGGPGYISNPPLNTAAFVSLGDGFVFFAQLPSDGQIKFTTTAAESANTINVRGFNSSGSKVYTGTGASRIEGENVTIPTVLGNSVTTSTTWNEGDSVYGVVKPQTNGVILVYHVASGSGTETLISSYEPGETTPNYRRYLVPKPCVEDSQCVVWAKVQHVPVAVDNDQIIPGNLNALEMALMAVGFRRKAEMERALEYFNLAIVELNDELFDFNAEESWPVMQIDPAMTLGPNANLF